MRHCPGDEASVLRLAADGPLARLGHGTLALSHLRPATDGPLCRGEPLGSGHVVTRPCRELLGHGFVCTAASYAIMPLWYFVLYALRDKHPFYELIIVISVLSIIHANLYFMKWR